MSSLDSAGAGASSAGEVLGADDVVAAQDDGPLHDVFQLPDVAGPGIADEDLEGFRGDAGLVPEVFLDIFFDEVDRQHGDVLPALAQGRQVEVDHVEAIEEVLPEAAGFHFFFEVAVGGGHHPDVHLDGAGAPHPFELHLLEDPEELDLEALGHLGDFVHEQGAVVGQFEAAFAHGHGVGEGAALVAEELALQEGFGEGGAVDGDEALVGPGAALVDGPGDEFLAGAALAGDEDRGPGLGHPFYQGEDLLHDLGFADDVGEAVLFFQFLVQEAVLEDEVAVLQGLGDGHHDLFVLEGLEDVVEGAFFHGRDGFFHGAESGHDDHGQVRVELLQFFQELDAAHLGHLHIGEDQVQVGGAGDLHGLDGAGGRDHFIARIAQEGLHDGEIIGFVVND